MRTATLTLRESRVARAMRVVALLATYNEERFVGGCIEHLQRQGIETYLIDNESTDATVEIAGALRARRLRDGPEARRLRLASAARAQGGAGGDARRRLVRPPRRRRDPPASSLRRDARRGDRRGRRARLQRRRTSRSTRSFRRRRRPTTTIRASRRRCATTTPISPGRPDRLNAWKRQDTRSRARSERRPPGVVPGAERVSRRRSRCVTTST